MLNKSKGVELMQKKHFFVKIIAFKVQLTQANLTKNFQTLSKELGCI